MRPSHNVATHRPTYGAPMKPKPSWGSREGDEIAPGLMALKRVGGGTRFEVYRAIDERRSCVVVAKLLRPDRVDDPTSLRLLRREARMLGRLAHPVIVRCFEATLVGPKPHLVLEHLEGPTLGSLLKRYGPLSIEQLLPLALEVTSALHYLASEEVVHLDIKPDNIIMGAPPRLIDFSIARSFERASSLRRPVGTRHTMAPEQCRPDSFGGVDAAADIWGLGVTLYEATCARPAFTAAGSESYPQLTKASEPLPAGTPQVLAEAIMRCLDTDPAARPTPAEISALLEPLVAALPGRPQLRRRRPRLS